MKKHNDTAGLIFSAILVISYVGLSYFFLQIINDSTQMEATVKGLMRALVFLLFGLLLFYATRVGEGKQVARFSLSTLLLLDVPAVYVLLASLAPGLPMPMDLTKYTEVVYLAAAALGYALPYTFLSGYEVELSGQEEEQAETKEENSAPGDMAEDLPEEEAMPQEEEMPEEDADSGETSSGEADE